MIVTLSAGVLDLTRRVFRRADGSESSLTGMEARVLSHLLAHSDRCHSREELQTEVWGYRAGISSRTVITTVGRVRQKIEADPAHPVHLVSTDGGYRLVVPTTAGRAPSLPNLPTPFVGRAADLATVERLVTEGARLVSVLGPGGIGKTRVAIEIARRLDPRFELGAALVSLEGVDTVEAMVRHVVHGLSLRPLAEGETNTAALVDRLRDRSQLVVLDNVEQIAGAGAAIAAVAVGCPRVALLVTSRVRLGVTAERAFDLGPMLGPAPGADLATADAGALALESAKRVRPAWTPTAQDAAALARVCALTEGSPLSIELATSWLRLLEPSELVVELERGADLLRAERADVPSRHTSVRAALEASFRLLAPGAVRALGALSAVRGSFDREVARAVADAGLSELGQLVDSSMIRRLPSGRFAFHPAVREEAAGRLSSVEQGDYAVRHRRFFLERLARTYHTLEASGTSDHAWLEDVSRSHEDVVHAFRDAAAARDTATLRRAVLPLFRYLEGTNRYLELEELWARVKGTLADGPLDEDGAVALGVLVAAERSTGRPVAEPFEVPEAATNAERALGCIGAALMAAMRSDFDAAGRHGEDAVAFARAGGARFILVFALSATARTQLGAPHARSYLTEAIALGERSRGRAYCRPLVHMGELHLAASEFEDARRTLRLAVRVCREADDRMFSVMAEALLGDAEHAAGDHDAARQAWTSSIDEAFEHHVAPFWARRAVLGLAERCIDDGAPGAAFVALSALRRALPGFGLGAERLGELLARAEAGLSPHERVELGPDAAALDFHAAALRLTSS